MFYDKALKHNKNTQQQHSKDSSLKLTQAKKKRTIHCFFVFFM